MLITGSRSLSSFLRIILDLVLLVNIVALILLPVWLKAIYTDPSILAQLDGATIASAPDITAEYPIDVPASSFPFYLAFMYAAGCGTAWILAEGHFILRRLEKNNPFTARQAGSFKRVGAAFAWLALAFAVKIVFYNTIMTMFCCGLFILIALIGLILSEIFRQAYLVKTENELTI